MKVAVIGGGASGVCAAIASKNKNNEVVIFERNNTLLKKILLTGNGRCNYFNDDQNIKHYYSKSNNKVFEFINEDSIFLVKNFFNTLGIIPKRENGWYYPFSNQAITIKEALLYELGRKNIDIRVSTLVTNIEILENKFIIDTDKEKFVFDKIILATGGMSYQKTGSDGFGYSMLKKLGHTIIEPVPSLVQLVGKENYFKKWNGIRVDARLNLYENDIKVKEEYGNLQLTDYGISGICSMQLSNLITRGLVEGKKESVLINFLPDFDNFNEFDRYLKNVTNNSNRKPLKKILDSLYNYKLVNLFFEILRFSDDIIYNDLNANTRKKLFKFLSEFKLEIVDTLGFDRAQTTSGGVSLDEINLKTMESLIIKNLYVTGELLDINGDCGGYNLTICWVSGLKVGKYIND